MGDGTNSRSRFRDLADAHILLGVALMHMANLQDGEGRALVRFRLPVHVVVCVYMCVCVFWYHTLHSFSPIWRRARSLLLRRTTTTAPPCVSSAAGSRRRLPLQVPTSSRRLCVTPLATGYVSLSAMV